MFSSNGFFDFLVHGNIDIAHIGFILVIVYISILNILSNWFFNKLKGKQLKNITRYLCIELLAFGLLCLILSLCEGIIQDHSSWIFNMEIGEITMFVCAIYRALIGIIVILLHLYHNIHYSQFFNIDYTQESELHERNFIRLKKIIFDIFIPWKRIMLRNSFIQHHSLPRSFDFVRYLELCHERNLLHLFNSSFHWGIGIIIIVLNYIRLKLHIQMNINIFHWYCEKDENYELCERANNEMGLFILLLIFFLGLELGLAIASYIYAQQAMNYYCRFDISYQLPIANHNNAWNTLKDIITILKEKKLKQLNIICGKENKKNNIRTLSLRNRHVQIQDGSDSELTMNETKKDIETSNPNLIHNGNPKDMESINPSTLEYPPNGITKVSEEYDVLAVIFLFSSPKLYFGLRNMSLLILSLFLGMYTIGFISMSLLTNHSIRWNICIGILFFVIIGIVLYNIYMSGWVYAMYRYHADIIDDVEDNNYELQYTKDILRLQICKNLHWESEKWEGNLNHLFDELQRDTNSYFLLKPNDLRFMLRQLNVHMTIKKFNRLFDIIDSNKDGILSLNEFFLFLFPQEMNEEQPITERNKDSIELFQTIEKSSYDDESVNSLEIGSPSRTYLHISSSSRVPFRTSPKKDQSKKLKRKKLYKAVEAEFPNGIVRNPDDIKGRTKAKLETQAIHAARKAAVNLRRLTKQEDEDDAKGGKITTNMNSFSLTTLRSNTRYRTNKTASHTYYDDNDIQHISV